MKAQIFKTPRRGLMGNIPLGVEYMSEINERVKRLKTAVREDKQLIDNRLQRLPGF
ncbi:hypothetical protein JWJ90_13465 [Desulfobulbus rhabdoformis]|jgi:hypothetical protein|uniref:hypothetical protein n=1 Tax=Desulfobulbus rhabdoformis TaxID=34032 RepID=UPI0019626A6A|nr:hypothetical protein [Desulfobulbus rhabdoformis]MBM9615287.1 hypothetical protein [Desulfobulbus rhabdoformis]